MGVGQLSESDAVDALRLPFYSSSHPTGSHGWRNQFDLGNPDLVPSDHEQREIVAVLDVIDCKIDLHRRKRAVLEELFKALLHKLMTGEIRVEELDISVLLGNTTQSKDAERIGNRA